MSDSKGGRPRIISSPEEFDRKVEAYRQRCIESGEPLTFAGMAYALGFADRRSLYDYAGYPGYSRSVKRAQLLVESEYERRLGESNYGGAIFALKNHGWSDQQQLQHSGPDSGPIEVSDGLSDDQRAARLAALLDAARARRAGSAPGADADDIP